MTDQRTSPPLDGTADPDFVTRVMASVATGPGPSAPRSFAGALRTRSGSEAIAAVTVAWHLAVRARSVPTIVRVQGLALVLAVALVAGAGVTVAATAAYRLAAPIVVAVTDRVLDDERVIPVAAPTASPRPVEPTPEPPEAIAPPEHGSDYDDADRPRGAIGRLPDADGGAAVDPATPAGDDDDDDGDHRSDEDDEDDADPGDDADEGDRDGDPADEDDGDADESEIDDGDRDDDPETGKDDGADEHDEDPADTGDESDESGGD